MIHHTIVFSVLSFCIFSYVSTVSSLQIISLISSNFATSGLQVSNRFCSCCCRTVERLRSENVLFSLSNCDRYAENPINIRIGGKWLGPIIRYINNLIVVFHRPKGSGLLTVSNHQSMLDDPGIWAAALPFWRLNPEKLRWSLCTEDVFFYNKFLTAILEAGNVVPLDRRGSIDQPLLRRFLERLTTGSWCQIFPEGRIFQSWRFKSADPQPTSTSNSSPAILGPLKLGVGKLVAHSPPSTVVLPIYHRGMDHVLPERRIAGLSQLRFQAPDIIQSRQQGGRSPPPSDQLFKAARQDRRNKIPMSTPLSAVPSRGRQVQMWIGQPLDFSIELAEFRAQHPNHPDLMVQGDGTGWRTSLPSIALYERITCKIQSALLALAEEADAEELEISL